MKKQYTNWYDVEELYRRTIILLADASSSYYCRRRADGDVQMVRHLERVSVVVSSYLSSSLQMLCRRTMMTLLSRCCRYDDDARYDDDFVSRRIFFYADDIELQMICMQMGAIRLILSLSLWVPHHKGHFGRPLGFLRPKIRLTHLDDDGHSSMVILCRSKDARAKSAVRENKCLFMLYRNNCIWFSTIYKHEYKFVTPSSFSFLSCSTTNLFKGEICIMCPMSTTLSNDSSTTMSMGSYVPYSVINEYPNVLLRGRSPEINRMVECLLKVYPYPVHWYGKQKDSVIQKIYNKALSKMVDRAIERDEENVRRRVEDKKERRGQWQLITCDEYTINFVYHSHTNKPVKGVISTVGMSEGNVQVKWVTGRVDTLVDDELISRIYRSSSFECEPDALIIAINGLQYQEQLC